LTSHDDIAEAKSGDGSESKGSGDEKDSEKPKKKEKKRYNWATKIIESNYFTFFSFLAIFGNTFILGMDSYYNKISTNEKLQDYNKAFTIYFMVEMVFKLYALGII